MKHVPFRISWFIFFALMGAAVFWTHEMFRTPHVYFPRTSADFRSPARRLQDETVLRAVLEKDPENIKALTDIAIAQFEQGPGQYVQALESLERARDLGAQDVRLFYYAGVMYEAQGLLDYARPEYARFLRHHSDDIDVQMRLANLSYRLGEMDKAAELYARVLQQKPADPVVVFNLALVYRDQRRWQEGLALMNQMAQSGHAVPEDNNRLWGDLYFGAGNYPEALSHFLRADARVKDNPEITEALASAYEQTGDLSQALNYWKKLVGLKPKHKNARDKIRLLQRKIRAVARASAPSKR